MSFLMQADGGSRGNPGPAASGAVLYHVKAGVREEIDTATKFLGSTTNNVAEYTAIIIGLQKAIKREIKDLRVELDSELAVKQIRGEYKVKNAGLQPLHREVKKLMEEFDEITFHHIRRELNTRADELVNETLDNR